MVAAAVILQQDNAVARPVASLSRAEVLTRYRHFREISKQHHSAVLNSRECRTYFCKLDIDHRDRTGWLGWEDSNSGIRARAMYLRYCDNSRWIGQNSPPETIRV
jgi:hypothetical protein